MMYMNLRGVIFIDCQFCGHTHSIETVCPELSVYLAGLEDEPRDA